MMPLDPVPQPIDTLPLRGAADAVALEDRAGTLTYAGLEAGVGGIAHWLAGRGLAPGERVATWLPKTRTACLMPLAAPRAGLVHVPVNPVLKRAQVAHILADSGARIVGDPGGADRGTGAGRRTRWLHDRDRGERVSTMSLPPSRADTDALAAILYTSGSTGGPRA